MATAAQTSPVRLSGRADKLNPATSQLLSIVFVQRYRGRWHARLQALQPYELNLIDIDKKKGASEDAPSVCDFGQGNSYISFFRNM